MCSIAHYLSKFSCTKVKVACKLILDSCFFPKHQYPLRMRILGVFGLNSLNIGSIFIFTHIEIPLIISYFLSRFWSNYRSNASQISNLLYFYSPLLKTVYLSKSISISIFAINRLNCLFSKIWYWNLTSVTFSVTIILSIDYTEIWVSFCVLMCKSLSISVLIFFLFIGSMIA